MSSHPHSEPCSCHPASAAAAPDDLQHLVDHVAHLLPAQGPIGVFVHHNTLHAFQHRPFEQAVLEAADLFGAEPYLTEAAYRAEIRRGRIRGEDLQAVLAAEPEAVILPGRLTRRQLRAALLQPGLREVDARNLNWLLEEGGWLESFRDDLDPEVRLRLRQDTPAALWQAALERARPTAPAAAEPAWQRPRDGLLEAFGVDLDEILHPLLIRLCAAFLDQGIAYWPMPLREQGLLAAARRLLLQPMTFLPDGLQGLRRLLRDQEARQAPAAAVVRESLLALGLDRSEWEAFLRAELLAMPGWPGLIRMLEQDPTLAVHERLPASLMDYLALRLSFLVAAVTRLAGDARGWRRHRPAPAATTAYLLAAARLFDVAQLVGLDSAGLLGLPAGECAALQAETAACDGLERRRLLQLAYERRHERQILLPLLQHRRLPPLTPGGDRLAAQLMFCIDEREESLRRHLEEVDPQMETFGAAGFFGVAVDYCGLDDARGVSLCPIVVKPAHAVEERPVGEHEHLHERRRLLRRVWAVLMRNSFISTRTLVRGWLSTVTLGFFSIFPLAVRVLSPLAYARMMKALNRRFLPEPRTELTFMRDDAEGKAAASGLLRGFSVQEKIERVAGVLGPMGLTKGLARLVVVLGHGSTSLNNPYESAYNCGACGGRSGGPNARLFAAMANHPAVRQGLRERGILIPEDTWFVGGYHDTCSDEVEFFDLDALPGSHHGDLLRVRASLDKARALSAHERTRRFEAAAWSDDAEDGLRHARERAEHLAEPRPEYGHCTNAVCIVGRREVTRGLFLDRRAFLVSYDAAHDADNSALGRVLGAVVPVCAGINLEYYFSTVDNERYGSGTKLPHNVTGLVGVMNGYQGDLLTGLPVQTVEIHEPVRCLFVVETTPERVLAAIRGNPQLREFLENRWIRLATLDPDSGRIQRFRDGVFEPVTGDDEGLPVAPSSMDWYRGRREHLPLARIERRRVQA